MGLTKSQKDELNQAIAEYLSLNYKGIHEEFCKQAQIQMVIAKESSKQNVLEKKWTTLVKLQRQIWDLEK